MITKAILYRRADGGVSILRPREGARLARSVTLADKSVIAAARPAPVDAFLRRWPVEGAVADWAETEDQFAARIAAKDLPPEATDVRVVDAAKIPAERAARTKWAEREAARS